MKGLLKGTLLIILSIGLATVESHMHEKEEEVENRKVKVMGKSGKISFGGKKMKNPVVIEFDGLTEVDSSGKAVGTTGSVKHSFKSFASQDFTFTQPKDMKIYNVSSKMFSFSSQLAGLNSTMKVYVYIIKENATVMVGGEEVEFRKGMLKFSIELSSWEWCGCMKGANVETGAFIDVAVIIKGKGAANRNRTRGAGKQARYDLGDGQRLDLSGKVEVDGAMQNMSTGFPKMETKGGKQVFTFRIPKFTQMAVYDPTIETAGSTDSDDTSSASITVFSAISLCVALIATIF